MPNPYGFTRDSAERIGRVVRRVERSPIAWQRYAKDERMFMPAIGATAVAITTTIIPARVSKTPGGPTTVTIYEVLTPGGDLQSSADDVEIYSWVKTDSADPADEPGGELLIYIAQDFNGTWWFIAQDCTGIPATIEEAFLSTDQILLSTPDALAGTTLTVQHEGIHNYAFGAMFSILGMAGGQDWELYAGLYDQSGADWLLLQNVAGTGPLTFNYVFNGSASLEFV